MVSSTPIIRPRSARVLPNVRTTPLAAKSRLALPVLIYFLAIALPIQFNAGPIFMTGVRAILIVMMIPMCLGLVTGKYGRIILTDVLFFLFAVWVVLTLMVNSPSSAISFGGSVAVEFFGGYLLGRAYIRSADDMVAMVRMLFYLVLFAIPFALYEGQTGRALILETIRALPVIDSIEDFYSIQDGRRLGLERVQVFFSHPIHYGLFCSTVFALMLVGCKGIYTTFQRYTAAALICFAAFLSLSSGAILPIMLQSGFIFWAVIFRRVESRWYILMGIIATFYVVIDLLSSRTPIDVFMTYATFSPNNAYWRKMIFEWGILNVWANPLLGIGLNNWFRPWYMYTSSVDNFWLLTAMRYGIPGFLLVALGFILPIWNIAWHRIEASNLTWQFRRAWVFTFLGLVLTLSTVDVWASANSYVAFLFGSGMWFLSVDKKVKLSAADARLRGANTDAEAADAPQDDPSETAAPSRYTRFGQNQTRK